MSALTDRIAAEHRPRGDKKRECLCGWKWGVSDWSSHGRAYTAHVAELTEAAVRAQIAADIKAKIDEPFGHEDHWWPGLVAAARIAAGVTA